jgi:hypothetical protein
MKHGKRGTYVRGCRCDACLEAARLYQRELRKRLTKRGAPNQHGTSSAYTHHGCRCDVCRDAHAALCASWRARQSVASAPDRSSREQGC